MNCNASNGYMCYPNRELTQLLEFCYIYPFIWMQECKQILRLYYQFLEWLLYGTKNRPGISKVLGLVIIICVVWWNIAFLNLLSYGFKLKGDEVFFAWYLSITLNLIYLYQFVTESFNETIIAKYSASRVAKTFSNTIC